MLDIVAPDVTRGNKTTTAAAAGPRQQRPARKRLLRLIMPELLPWLSGETIMLPAGVRAASFLKCTGESAPAQCWAKAASRMS